MLVFKVFSCICHNLDSLLSLNFDNLQSLFIMLLLLLQATDINPNHSPDNLLELPALTLEHKKHQKQNRLETRLFFKFQYFLLHWDPSRCKLFYRNASSFEFVTVHLTETIEQIMDGVWWHTQIKDFYMSEDKISRYFVMSLFGLKSMQNSSRF